MIFKIDEKWHWGNKTQSSVKAHQTYSSTSAVFSVRGADMYHPKKNMEKITVGVRPAVSHDCVLYNQYH